MITADKNTYCNVNSMVTCKGLNINAFITPEVLNCSRYSLNVICNTFTENPSKQELFLSQTLHKILLLVGLDVLRILDTF